MSAHTAPAVPPKPKNERLPDVSKGIKQFLEHGSDFFLNSIAQVRIYDRAYAGIMHALLFWGVTIQVLGTAINLMQMKLFLPFELTFPREGLYLAFELVMDLAGVAILVGVLMAGFRRLVLRPKSLETRWDDIYALVLLLVIPIAGFAVEATRLISASPDWSLWSPIGRVIAGWFGAMGLTREGAVWLHGFLFWTHAALALTLLASIPYTKLRHLVNTPLNILLRNRKTPGIPAKIDNIEEAEILGVGQIREFTPRQLLSFDACVRCGRCDDACPVVESGTTYAPRLFVQSLRRVMDDTLTHPERKKAVDGNSLPDLIGPQSPWSCTTCGACLERCPAFVNPVDEVIDLRRYLALTTGKLPKTVADTLRNFERQGNPWGLPPEERIAWTEDLGVRELAPGDQTDVLLYLGCAFAFDARNRKAAAAFARLLQKANVEFGILGFDETCCGDMARRLGQEYLFQVFAEQLNETLEKVHFNRIVTPCPHCFNALKNEYSQLGYHFPVQHAAEFLVEHQHILGKPCANGNGIHERTIYHDSCYLGRYNQVYAEPRELLKLTGLETTEFSRNREESFCCGGGGGQMWMENDAEKRINHIRLQEALDHQAGVIATACPYCLLMFDDAIRSKGLRDQVQVLDLSEILEKQLPG